MGILRGLLSKLGLEGLAWPPDTPVRVFLLDDDTLRHEWFAKRFRRDHLDVAVTPEKAIELLSANHYDAIFLDHDLLPEHYYAETFDDRQTGYAVASWLAANPQYHQSSVIIVHTRNADAAMRMVEELRRVGRQAENVPFHMLSPKIKKYLHR